MQNTTKNISALIESTLKDKNEFDALLKRLTPKINQKPRSKLQGF